MLFIVLKFRIIYVNACIVHRESMALDRRSALIIIVLILASAYLTFYTMRAHTVARHVYEEEGAIVWRSGPSGSFFPWPMDPGPLQVLSEMNAVDVFIYGYLIKSWALVGVTILLWVGLCLYIFKAFRMQCAN